VTSQTLSVESRPYEHVRAFARAHLTNSPIDLTKEPYWVNVRLQHDDESDADKDDKNRIPVFLPHEYIAELQRQQPSTLQRVLFGEGGIDEVEEYWRRNKSHEWCSGHPAHMAGDVTIPMELFGDDATIWKTESLLILTMKSVLAEGKSFDTTLLLAVLPLNRVVPNETLPDLYRAVAWSFKAAVNGLWPESTHEGEPLCPTHGQNRYKKRGQSLGILRLGLARVTGDWKFLKETYHLRNYSTHACCHRCLANKNPDEGPLYTDVGPTAAWRATATSHMEFMEEQEASGHRSPLTDIPGWRLEMVKTDLMHNMCLGSAQHLIGSVIVQLVQEGHWGPPRGRWKECLLSGFKRFRTWKRDHKLQCSKHRWSRSGLTWTSARVYPCLKAKAHNTRILLAWTHVEARAAADRNPTEAACMRAACTWALARFAWDLDRFPRKLTPDMATALEQSGRHFLNTYMWLAKHCLRLRKCFYALKPKLHLSTP
jgi:hypothetical protein